MESRLVIFIALTAVQLISNTLVIVVAFKIFSGMATKVTESVNDFQKKMSMREWLASLQSLSEQAAKVTGEVRDQIVEFDPALERMQAAYVDGLSRADVRLKLTCRAIHFTAEKLETLAKWPLRKASTSSAFFNGVVEFIRGRETDADARPRRTR